MHNSPTQMISNYTQVSPPITYLAKQNKSHTIHTKLTNVFDQQFSLFEIQMFQK